ncbi:hypothetical protein N7497_006140 [Penicillium chrysogenum]|jgi:hypothetical protein|nr:hypothetical protein N7497_006140 [Penicillium chrysogenum]
MSHTLHVNVRDRVGQDPSPLSQNQPVGISMVVFISVAIYNALELMVLIPLTFQRYHSLYFWSLLTSAVLGVVPTSIGTSFQYFELAPLWLTLVLSNIGFIMMVPNQSVVLYSRLHLVSQNCRLLLFLKWLIIVGTIIIIVPTIPLNCGTEYIRSTAWTKGYQVVERAQITWFSAQEILISSIYIKETTHLIQINPEDKRRTKILYELITINVMAIAMDVALLTLEYLGLYFTQIILKAMVYSIKLKLEFAVLGTLVSIAHFTPRGSSPSMRFPSE